MVLHRSNFEIPARFRFRPFNVRWQICTAELVGWLERPKSSGVLALGRPMVKPFKESPEHELVTVRIEGPGEPTAGMLGGLYGTLNTMHTAEMFRSDIPSDVLLPHENRKTSPDISGRTFSVLVCKEYKTLFPFKRPGDATKNAWAMRDEFLNLDGANSEDPLDWLWSLRQFLNRWGLWSPDIGFHTGLNTQIPAFAVAFPHLLRQKREEYRKALEGKSARKWLSTARPLSFTTIDEFPHFVVERFYCEEAIEATITIDHLAERKFGFCKRCGKQFEQETEHKKNYCSRQCIQAAGVKRWREKQRKSKPNWTAAKIAKVLKQQREAKRNAKG